MGKETAIKINVYPILKWVGGIVAGIIVLSAGIVLTSSYTKKEIRNKNVDMIPFIARDYKVQDSLIRATNCEQHKAINHRQDSTDSNVNTMGKEVSIIKEDLKEFLLYQEITDPKYREFVRQGNNR